MQAHPHHHNQQFSLTDCLLLIDWIDRLTLDMVSRCCLEFASQIDPLLLASSFAVCSGARIGVLISTYMY